MLASMMVLSVDPHCDVSLYYGVTPCCVVSCVWCYLLTLIMVLAHVIVLAPVMVLAVSP